MKLWSLLELAFEWKCILISDTTQLCRLFQIYNILKKLKSKNKNVFQQISFKFIHLITFSMQI